MLFLVISRALYFILHIKVLCVMLCSITCLLKNMNNHKNAYFSNMLGNRYIRCLRKVYITVMLLSRYVMLNISIVLKTIAAIVFHKSTM